MSGEFYMAIAWIILAVILAYVEAQTAQFVSIWGAIAALVTALPAYLGVSFEIQLMTFALTTGLLLALTRPFVSKIVKSKRVHTNAKMVIGCIGIVTQEIDNEKNTGRITVNGDSWSARSEINGEVIPSAVKVEVLKIEGVKLIVKLRK